MLGISFVGGQSALAVATGTVLALSATAIATPNTLVKRDNNGSFSGSVISANQFNGGSIILQNGSITDPSIQFIGSSTAMGIYSPTGNDLAISTNGIQRFNIDPSGNTTYTNLYRLGTYSSATTYGFTGSGTGTIPFNTIIFDSFSGFNTSTYTYTCPYSGYYNVSVNINVEVSGTPATVRRIQLVKNGNLQIGYTNGTAVSTNNQFVNLSFSGLIQLNTGDKLNVAFLGTTTDRIGSAVGDLNFYVNYISS